MQFLKLKLKKKADIRNRKSVKQIIIKYVKTKLSTKLYLHQFQTTYMNMVIVNKLGYKHKRQKERCEC